MSPKIETSLESGVLTVTLADEANRNALGKQLLNELIATIDCAEADRNVRVVVLTNRGSVFSAGADLAERLGSDEQSTPTADMASLFGRIISSPKPFIGRIAGHAIAGGVGLAASLDISIAADTTRFGFTEVRLGVAPAIISVVCLPKMRRAEAAEAFLRGSRFSAAEAAQMGLINRAVAAEELDSEISAVVEDVLMGGPAALGVSKQLLRQVPSMDFDAAISWAAGVSGDLFASAEGQEGIAAYLAKRRPEWAPEPG